MIPTLLILMLSACGDKAPALKPPKQNEKDGSVLRSVPAGEYWIGSEEGGGDESPRHPISLEAFWIAEFEVTHKQYVRFLNAQSWKESDIQRWIGIRGDLPRASEIIFTGRRYRSRYGYEEHPVFTVSYYGAKAYCSWAGLRLPTEFEWEVAAKGGRDDAVYPWGNESPSEEKALFGKRWRDVTVPAPIVPVKQFPPNGYGLYDMAGSVYEWTSSPYLPYKVDSLPKFLRFSLEGRMVVRGGSWGSHSEELRISFRRNYFKYTRSNFVGGLGFRCAESENRP